MIHEKVSKLPMEANEIIQKAYFLQKDDIKTIAARISRQPISVSRFLNGKTKGNSLMIAACSKMIELRMEERKQILADLEAGFQRLEIESEKVFKDVDEALNQKPN